MDDKNILLFVIYPRDLMPGWLSLEKMMEINNSDLFKNISAKEARKQLLSAKSSKKIKSTKSERKLTVQQEEHIKAVEQYFESEVVNLKRKNGVAKKIKAAPKSSNNDIIDLYKEHVARSIDAYLKSNAAWNMAPRNDSCHEFQPDEIASSVNPKSKEINTQQRSDDEEMCIEDSHDSVFLPERENMTAQEINNKALLDLLVGPVTTGLTTLGVSLLLISWAFGLSAIFPFLGLIAILAGVGVATTSFIFNYEEAVSQALKAIQEQARLVKEEELDQLDAFLVAARGPQPDRDQSYLRELRTSYEHFLKDVEQGNLSEFVSEDIIKQIKDLFDGCIKSLSYSYDLWTSANKVQGKTREDFLNDREAVIDEVGKSVDRFNETIIGIRNLNLKSKKGDLGKLRQQLDDSLEVARKTEQRMAELEGGSYGNFRTSE